jgi:hypothetical protein
MKKPRTSRVDCFNLPIWILIRLEKIAKSERRSKSQTLTMILEKYFKNEKP